MSDEIKQETTTPKKTRRGNNFGCLVPKGEGPYLARWMYQGKIFTKSTGESDRAKAEKVLEKLTRPFREEKKENVIKNLEFLLARAREAAKEHKKLPIKQLWQVYEEKLWDSPLTESTKAVYKVHIEAVVGWMSRKVINVNDIKRGHCEEYLKEIADSVSATTYNARLMLLSKIWHSLAEEYSLTADLWDGFQRKKTDSQVCRREFTTDELKRIFAKCEADKDLKLLIALGIYTGLRISDCAKMSWESVDLEQKTISLTTQKTKAFVVIPIHAKLLELIKNIDKGDSYYLSPRNARQFASKRLQKRLTELFNAAGIVTSKKENGKMHIIAGFHSLRHTFVSIAINSGINPLIVQKIVGHANINMTSHYYHQNKEAVDNMVAKIPDFF